MHLEGSIRPETVLQLARRNHIALPADSVDGLRDWYRFRDFPHFVQVYVAVSKTIKTADDITRKLGLACLGLVPAVEDSGSRPVLSSAASGHFGEAIRSLRTSVAFCNPIEGNTILLITSAQPLEGKTTTA
mgnify:CR=1 FL=1